MKKFIIKHTGTGHTYKGGFNTRVEGFDWYTKHKAKLKKYLPADCNSGEFVVVEDV